MKIKWRGLKYILIAFFAHLIILVILAPIYIISPYVREALLKGKLKERKAPTAPSEGLKPKIEQKLVAEVPVHLLKKKPEGKERIGVDKKMRIPTVMEVPKTIVPRGVKLSRKHKMGSDRIISKERTRRRKTYKQFAKKFHVSGKGKSTKAVFTPVLVRYSGGDWDKDPKALPNLMREISRRSNVKANEKPRIVGVSSEEIFSCPFVYFTGAKDFRFTESEVQSLRKYLLQGGLVWVDNGLSGRRSQCDIAFRREMKRVLPDRYFEPIPMNHPVFSSFYRFREVPQAMNYKDDPLEMMKIDKRVAVIYTLNAYVSFWRTMLNKDGTVATGWDKDWQHEYGDYWHPWNRWRYDNLSQESIENAYRLGINIVVYLLTR